MKKTIIFLQLVLICSVAKSQITKPEELIGKWKTVSVNSTLGQYVEPEFKDRSDSLVKLMNGTEFQFNKDGSFSMKIAMTAFNVKKAHWEFKKETNTILIQELNEYKKNKLLLMEIEIKMIDGKMCFFPIDSFSAFEVQKVE
jgi:hypothetical protein